MSTIYDNSALYIITSGAASTKPNPTDGLFCTREPLTIKPCHIKTPLSTETHNHVLAPWKLFERLKLETPLSSRGWIYQEPLLAPCTLYFSRTQLARDCRAAHLCETFPSASGIPRALMWLGDAEEWREAARREGAERYRF